MSPQDLHPGARRDSQFLLSFHASYASCPPNGPAPVEAGFGNYVAPRLYSRSRRQAPTAKSPAILQPQGLSSADVLHASPVPLKCGLRGYLPKATSPPQPDYHRKVQRGYRSDTVDVRFTARCVLDTSCTGLVSPCVRRTHSRHYNPDSPAVYSLARNSLAHLSAWP